MRCPRCHVDNEEQARFCGACGARLEPECPRCAHANPAGSRFCNECGQPLAAGAAPPAYTPRHLVEKVLTSHGALEGERKQVTVLFVDVVEYSGLAERLEPEALHDVMSQILRLMAEAVHRYEGTVNQFLGDGLMALFGAPLALEHHALRAVQAALAILETVRGYNQRLLAERGLALRLRVGVNSGLVVVGKIGDDLRMDYTAVGDTTNLAARLQAAAEPDAILVSEATHRLVDRYVRSEALGPVAVKGREKPVPVYGVIGRRSLRSHLEASAGRGLTELVDRERELAVLRECFARARAGQGQVVGIVGEPGVGKSRLLHAFRTSIQDERITWLEGHCVAWGQGTPYLPVLDMCRANFEIEEGDNPLQIEAKLGAGVRRIDPGLERIILPPLRELFGLPGAEEAFQHVDSRERRRRVFEAIRMLTLAGSARRPQVFVFEDLQWIDETSAEYMAYLIESLAARPTLLVTTQRPGTPIRWMNKTYYTHITLGVLGEQEVEAMVARILGTWEVPPDLLGAISEKAEGNPLFVEEIVSSLRDRGLLVKHDGSYLWPRGALVTVSGTVQDIVSARLDRLPEPIKRTVQTAAVIGRAFGLSLLTRVAESGPEVLAHLDTLRRLELVQEARVFPEPEYAFKHAVIQDVAYQSLLLPRRQELHGAIGRAIEELHVDRLDEQAAMLAHHFSRSAQRDRAIAHSLAAGDRAARLYASAEATIYYQQALALARALPSAEARAAEIDAAVKLAAVGITSQDVVERDRANLERARGLAEGLGDQARLAQVLYWLGRTDYVLWRPVTAVAYARQSLEIAEGLGDERLAAPPVNLMGRIYWQQSDFGRASELLERSVEQMRRLGNRAEESTAAGFAGVALGYLGEFARARAHAEHGVQVAREIANPFAEASAYLDRAVVRGEQGEWDVAIADFEEARRVAERAGDVFRVYVVKLFEGRAHTMAGRPERGRALIQQSLDEAAEIGAAFARAWQTCYLADARLALGQAGAAAGLCEEAVRLAEETGDRFVRACALATLAEARFALDPAARAPAEAAIRTAVELHRDLGTRPERARATARYARLLAAWGEPRAAAARRAEARALFEAMGMAWDLERA